MKLLIVDDEVLAIEWISGLTDWNVLGITKVYTAGSVEQAKRIFLQYDIDIVLLDVEMPQEDGFVLLEWMREQKVSAECIFLTGHDEFKYAQRAIKYGCLSYLLKPVEEEELFSTVAEAVRQIKEKEEIRQKTLYSTYWKSNKESFVEKFYADTLLQRISEKQIINCAKQISLDVEHARFQIIILDLRFLHVEFIDWGENMKSFVIRNILSETIASNVKESVILPLSDDEWVVLLEGDLLKNANTLKNESERFIKGFGDYLKSTVTVYIGKECGIHELAKNYMMLQSYMKENVAYFGSILYQEEMPLWKSYFCTEVKFKEWKKQLQDKKIKEVYQEICEFLDFQVERKSISRKVLEKFYRQILVMFLEVADIDKQNISGFIDSAFTQDVILKANRSVEDIKQIIHMLLREIFENQLSKEKTYDRLSDRVSDYIKNNMGGELNCDSISSVFGFNTDYLSRIIKQECGKTLGELYTELRMNHAKKLLELTDLSITEVAIRSGYRNVPHFSKMFRTIHGFSPSTYRKKNIN